MRNSKLAHPEPLVTALHTAATVSTATAAAHTAATVADMAVIEAAMVVIAVDMAATGAATVTNRSTTRARAHMADTAVAAATRTATRLRPPPQPGHPLRQHPVRLAPQQPARIMRLSMRSTTVPLRLPLLLTPTLPMVAMQRESRAHILAANVY